MNGDWGPCGPPPPAFPARPPHYVLPGSHLLDPFYVFWLNPNYPFPRFPRPFETQTRADGTGLIAGNPCQPAPPPTPCPPAPSFQYRQPIPPPAPLPHPPWRGGEPSNPIQYPWWPRPVPARSMPIPAPARFPRARR